MLIPFGPFTPDQPVLGQTSASVAKNCIPQTDKSYGPFASLSAITGALGATCQGAIAVRSNDGVVHVFAGTVDKLYKLSGTTWNDVSKSGGYATPSDGMWSFVQMGNRIICTNYFDAIQTYLIGTDSVFSDLSSGAPKCKYLAVIKGFLVAFATNDTTDGEVQNRAWWAAFGDPTSWPTPGGATAEAAQSDYQDLEFGGGISGALGGVGGRHGVVWLQDAIYVMTYSGPPTVFDFQDAERGIGTTIPGSIVNLGLFAGYISENGFQFFDGTSSHSIGTLKVDRFFWDNVDQEKLLLIRSAQNPKRKIVMWAYSVAAAVPDRILIYNWETAWWSYVETEVELLLKGYTAGFDIDTDAGYTDDDLLDSDAPGLDSQAFMGGRVLAAGFDSSHKFGFFDGANLEATFETGDFLEPSGRMMFCDGAMPIVDAATATLAIGYRASQSASASYTTATSPASDGYCPQRIEARYLRARVTVASAQSWTHGQGIIPRMRAMGTR